MPPERQRVHLVAAILRSKLGSLVLAMGVSTLVACAQPTVTVSVPLGSLGQVGVRVGNNGSITGHVGVGTNQGGVTVGADVDIPIVGSQ